MAWDLARSTLLNLIVALVLGTMIGAERQWRHRTAGLKTSALVSVGAASFVTMAASAHSGDAVARIAAQIVSGIGFLGAGVILRDGPNVRGLNTAATIWCSAAAGTLAGAGDLILGTLVAILILTVNILLQPMVNFINRRPAKNGSLESLYSITIRCVPAMEAELRDVLTQQILKTGLSLDGVAAVRIIEPPALEMTFQLRQPTRNDTAIEALLDPLLERQGVMAHRWTIEAMAE